MNRKIFEDGMILMAKIFGKAIPNDVLEVYWSVTCHMNDDEFKNTVAGILKSFHPTSQCPFPVPADFVNASGSSDRDSGRIAIAKIKRSAEIVGAYESVNFRDDAIHLTIQAFGGWPVVARWTDEDWQLNERRFEETYEAYRRRNTQGPKLLPGLHEISNAAGGRIDMVKQPKQIGEGLKEIGVMP